MNTKRNIPFSPPDMTEAEVLEVAEAMKSGMDNYRTEDQGV